MKIAFDQQVFLLQAYGGISRYICGLVKELNLIDDIEAHIIAPLHFNRNLAELKQVSGAQYLLPEINGKLFRPVMLASKYLARYYINHLRPDILHETYYSLDHFRPKSAKIVLTVYDLIHERYSNFFERSHMTIEPKRASIQRADHVICISESTRRDVIEYYGIAPEKTSVVYLGVDVEFIRFGEQVGERVGPPRAFLLYVGVRGGYKNFDRFLRAFARSPRLKSEFDIVCFGSVPFSCGELKAVRELGLRQDQLIHHYGSDALLAKLYREASALIYPSLYEGFGIPPLEAMAVGCPVICSNNSSLPEVVGQAAETFDPLDEEAMLAALENVLNFPSRRKALIEAGRDRYPMFSWGRCARETLDIYSTLL